MAHSRGALWVSGHDESVEVNQRALIDKVLARYSGEFTVFRELLQNSDDAQSKAVEIHFETQGYVDRSNEKHRQDEAPGCGQALPDLKTALVYQWVFKNNGIEFRDEDWNRLKKIAEGNPDEEKIGAFGVGFYSLFSVTEEPFITSGGSWMGFYWKDNKDQLFARRGSMRATNTSDAWTSFEMTLREATPIPSAFDFTSFLASSITFMTHLSDVSVYFDDKRLVRLTKSSGIPRELGIPNGLQSMSPTGIMNVKGIKSTPVHIKAEVMRWVYSTGTDKPAAKPSNKLSTPGSFFSLFSSLAGITPPRSVVAPLLPPKEEIDPSTINETSVVLSIFSADVHVKLDKKIAVGLHRSTKKNAPGNLKYELIYTAKDEYDASMTEEEMQPFTTGSVFQGLRADLEGLGSARVFIGHATAQTTGLGGHMATRFIPTVERESIDLVDLNVAVWNRELLYVGGFLARSAYELELANIQNLWEGAISSKTSLSVPNPELQAWLYNRSLHTLKFFTFHPSTPSSDVSSLLEMAFFSCGNNRSFPVLSTAGVRNALEVRLPDATFSGFLKNMPVLPEALLAGAQPMVSALRNRGMIKSITFVDVLNELRSRPLSEDEMIACLKWWIGLNAQGDNPNLLPIRTELLNAALLITGTAGGPDGTILPLASVTSFISTRNILSSMIPTDGPLPPYVIPLSISRHFPPDVLLSSFPWTELLIVDWLRYVISPEVRAAGVEHDINQSAPWAERVLTVLARSWPSLSNGMKDNVAVILHDRTCVPTSAGLKLPQQAYFANANIFRDLPIVTLPSGTPVKGTLEKVLQFIGVRRHVDLQVVFDRMIKTGDWTIADLIKYLVAVRSTLNSEEIDRLKMTAAFSSEGDRFCVIDQEKPIRRRANQLYEPLEIFRQLKIPIIDWGTQTKWRASSEEAKFLYELGLRRYPPLNDIINLCASPDPAVRPIALKYLLDNITTHYKHYDPLNFADIEFIPATTSMGRLKEVFVNSEWATLGFLVVQPSLQHDALSKLKLREHPPTPLLVALLEKTPPKDHDEACKWFGILAGRISDFTPAELKKLSQLPIVPTRQSHEGKSEGTAPARWLPPSQCFFGGGSKAPIHSKLFVYIDFGTPANGFLNACGTKHEPSVEEISQSLLADPHKFYELATSRNNFLTELRNIAVNIQLISSSTLGRMKKAPILLGSRRKLRSKTEKGPDPEELEEDDCLQYDLRRPGQVFIADDTNAYQLFGDSIFTAPQEDLLEDFYAKLGSRRLSSLVLDDYQAASEMQNQSIAAETRSLILERLPLFLHEHTHAQARVSSSWLCAENNFVVRIFGKLSVTKSLNCGDARLSRSQDAYAVAKRNGNGPIQLWLAANAQVDMYEVATSLCRLLFDSPKANDALLFMTILSTDLRALKRRGYNVDRILRQQKADKEARTQDEDVLLLSTPLRGKLVTPHPTRSTSPSTTAAEIPSSVREKDATTPQPRPTSTLQNWKRKFGSALYSSEAENGGLPAALANSLTIPSHPVPNLLHSVSSCVTPLSNISSNIDQAIKACIPETQHLLRNREKMQQVKESLNEGYCDISGRAGDLDLIGIMGEVKVFASRDIPQPRTILATKHDTIARFIHIMQPLARVYKLPLPTLHIFYDVAGDLIAFNRNASIFLNLRFFEAWHDEDVQKGFVSPAYISWYFTLAHEIAHNLVQPHNSEHEFYFSAICERHILELGRLLSPAL